MTDRGEAELREFPDHRHTPGDHVLDQSGKEHAYDLRASGHQQMGVPTLRNTPPIPSCLRQRVAFQDRDSLVSVGQHPGGEKPGNTGPEDHRVVTDLPHLTSRVVTCTATLGMPGVWRLRGKPPKAGQRRDG
jgi:hypothetical protein